MVRDQEVGHLSRKQRFETGLPEERLGGRIINHNQRALGFLSILSIKCRNLFYRAENMEAEEREENKEDPLFMSILS